MKTSTKQCVSGLNASYQIQHFQCVTTVLDIDLGYA
jgi:hypothetical protein